MFNKSGNGPSNPSSDLASGSDSPTSSMDHFSLHDCLPEDQHQNQRQIGGQQENSRSDLTMDSSYQLHQHQQHGIADYSNLPNGLNYCSNLMELQ